MGMVQDLASLGPIHTPLQVETLKRKEERALSLGKIHPQLFDWFKLQNTNFVPFQCFLHGINF